MSKEEKRAPEVRFEGFYDDWEQRKLGEIAIRVRGNDGRMNLPTLTISAGNGWMDQRDRFSQNIAGKEQKNYTLLRQGELSYNHGNSKLAQFGAVFELESYNEALVPRVYHSFSVTAGAQPKFIEQMFATHRPDRELRKLVSSGARMDGLLNINYDDFMGIKVWLPSVAEQQAIAGLLVKLDNTIALHQEKLSKLQSLKKAALQSLFPQKDETEPKVRFANFKSKWSQRQLGETLIERNIQQTQSIEYPLVSFTVQDGVTPKTERYNRQQLVRGSKKDKKYKVTEFNDIVYNPANLKFGAIARNKYGKAVLSPIYVTFRVNQEIVYPSYIEMTVTNPDFIKYSLRYQQGTVYERQSVNPEDLLSLYISIPEKEEQSDIGLFFEQLNNDVELYKSKLEKLQRLKKSFLQRMFI